MIRRPPRSTLFPYTTALPIYDREPVGVVVDGRDERSDRVHRHPVRARVDRHLAEDRVAARVDDRDDVGRVVGRSEEHTSELQSRQYIVCRLLLEKKKNI